MINELEKFEVNVGIIKAENKINKHNHSSVNQNKIRMKQRHSRICNVFLQFKKMEQQPTYKKVMYGSLYVGVQARMYAV